MSIAAKIKKHPFGTAQFTKMKDVYYLAKTDTFEIRFENGVIHSLENRILKKANHIKKDSVVIRVYVDEELGSGFFVEYTGNQKAEASWAFVLEETPKK